MDKYRRQFSYQVGHLNAPLTIGGVKAFGRLTSSRCRTLLKDAYTHPETSVPLDFSGLKSYPPIAYRESFWQLSYAHRFSAFQSAYPQGFLIKDMNFSYVTMMRGLSARVIPRFTPTLLG